MSCRNPDDEADVTSQNLDSQRGTDGKSLLRNKERAPCKFNPSQAKLWLVIGNRRFKDGTDHVRFDQTRQIQPGEDVLNRTRGHDGPLFDDDHVVGQL